MRIAPLNNFYLVNCCESGHSMELRRDVAGDLHAIGVGMGGFGYARIVNSGQSCVPVLLAFLHKTEEQSLVLLIFFFQIWDLFSVCVVVLLEGRVICQGITTFVEFSTCCWFRRTLRTLLSQYSQYSVLQAAATKVKGACVYVCVCESILPNSLWWAWKCTID